MNRWLAGHVFWPLTERLVRRDTMVRLRALQRTEGWPAERLRDLQDRKLRRLLRLAGEHCPFYARRFANAGLDPLDLTLTASDLARIPTLSRGEIREHLDGLLWRGCPRGRPRRYSTGGSSGEPLIFYTDAARQAADWAARWRARRWWGVNPGDQEILLWGAPVELRAQDRLRRWRDALLNQRILSAFEMSAATMQAYAGQIRRRRPACLYGYASSLALLARHLLEGGGSTASEAPRGLKPAALGGLRAVFVTGEVLTEADRAAIGEAFAAPVVIEYGCRDGGLLACGCPAGRLHVPDENVILELLDDDGRPVAPGEIGEVAVTYLETFAMPVIRYRVGDLARAAVGPCPCGRASHTLLEIRGRSTDQIVCRRNGRIHRMHALALMYVLREAEGLHQFRIVQPSLDQLDVQVVADARFNRVQAAVERGLAERMGPGVDIRIRRCQRIPATASGKHACVVSHVAENVDG